MTDNATNSTTNSASELDEWLTLADAAKEVDKAANTLRFAISAGNLKATQKGRPWLVKRSDLLAWASDPKMHKPGLGQGQKINRKPRDGAK